MMTGKNLQNADPMSPEARFEAATSLAAKAIPDSDVRQWVTHGAREVLALAVAHLTETNQRQCGLDSAREFLNRPQAMVATELSQSPNHVVRDRSKQVVNLGPNIWASYCSEIALQTHQQLKHEMGLAL